MENPKTWGEAEKIVLQAIDSFYKESDAYGASLPRTIVNALRHAGLLKE